MTQHRPAQAVRPPLAHRALEGSGRPSSYEVVAVNLDPQADNRIHDDDVARSFGFRGALVPGVEVAALASVPLVQAWGEEFLARGRMSLRFRAPVYDGERIRVEVDRGLTVTGPDGVLRASGEAVAAAAPAPVADYPQAPLPEVPADRPEVLGTLEVPADPAACAEYVRRLGDPSPLYADLVHPGLVLRLVNLVLMRNVGLGPWIHTATDCRFTGLLRVDEAVQVRSRVVELYERGGHDRVRYDALLLARGRAVAEVRSEAIWRLAGG